MNKYLVIEVISDVDCVEPGDSMLNCHNVLGMANSLEDVHNVVQKAMDGIRADMTDDGFADTDWYIELNDASNIVFGETDSQAFAGELQCGNDERLYCADYFAVKL